MAPPRLSLPPINTDSQTAVTNYSIQQCIMSMYFPQVKQKYTPVTSVISVLKINAILISNSVMEM